MPTATLPTPTPEELEDLIYFSRTGDVESLKETVEAVSTKHKSPASVILASAIDIDADGLGSQASLLHYPAANGNLEVVKYLLSLLVVETQPTGETTSTETQPPVDKSAPQLVNHRNVSGNTPLHWAAVNGHLEVVRLLVQHGADPTIVNAAGRDAVVEAEFSARDGADKCAEWMLKNCDGLEKGIGGGAGEGSAGEREGDDLAEEDEESETIDAADKQQQQT
ncbi:hypothetical protein B0A52_03141 [Exophiala mesophila]|uniref:protein S-acyltransferase n=1 Tax=Exophiala mesophila TaxID=212818 RepID=A0A438NAI3_EXOME|nr:hypothetical protein B0A52_03141 [Exophiala mesophila]